MLSLTQKKRYKRDGFLILPDFLTVDICDLLIDEGAKLIINANIDGIKTIFSSKNRRHQNQLYFLESGDKIGFFFEEGAINAKGELQKEKLFAINKIGHALHDLNPIFNSVSRSHKVATLIKELDILNPLLIQSMYICKQPYIGSEVLPHQDSTYLFVKNNPITGLWFALQDATLKNGCLWVIPGGHRGPLKSRFIRDANNETHIEVYDGSPWSLEKMIPLPVSRGSVIALHGLLPHMSYENTSSHGRHAYTLHVMSANDEFATDNWLKRPKEMPFRGFLE